MIKSALSVVGTKEKVKSFSGKNVEVKLNLGRNKFASYKGTVTAVYPALFTVTPNDAFNGKTSFSYSGYMCGVVDLIEI